jgi:hypothetical protein
MSRRASPRAARGSRCGCCCGPRPLAVGGAGALLDLELHEPLDDVCQELADDVVPGPLLNELRK